MLLLIVAGCWPVTLHAQGIDVLRKAAIYRATSKAKKTLEAQEKAQGMMTTGHMWTREEIETTTAFQQEFSEYLDTINDIIAIAAEIYGIFYEVKQTSKNISNINQVLAASPTNALAVAFSAKRNVVYRNIISNSVDILMDIRKVCFEKSKMTEQERNAVISSVRKKLRKFNKQLQSLTLTLYYTSLTDVYNEILNKYYRITPEKKTDIIRNCRKDWYDNVKSIHKR